jgi:nuclear pore complex protein Nup205
MIYRVLDDLNPLYVYEAKMSLFMRIAQTRQGAERLIDSRVLPILADCDFLDTLPEADQSFIGMLCSLLCYWWLIWWLDHNHFLPSAIQRYHQLLLPALQLVNTILATLGSGHSIAVNHVRYNISSSYRLIR